ncbi:hypothetical protein [uncultured Mediterranean phage uvDeep-CGR2-KM18-C74]|nr:hypothetical protein [uncultured Mediterranean phage uvDeep-CGR2-KM18-C74]
MTPTEVFQVMTTQIFKAFPDRNSIRFEAAKNAAFIDYQIRERERLDQVIEELKGEKNE